MTTFKQEDLQVVHQHLLTDALGENKLMEDSWHQSIMEAGYQWWQSDENGGASYGEMIRQAEETFGTLPVLLILLGKYNQQVENGGHSQYLFNGYAGDFSGSRESSDPDLDLHENMMHLMKKFKLDETVLGQKLISLLQKFVVIDDCDDEEYWDEEANDGEGEMVQVDACDLEHNWVVLNGESMDDIYYKFNEQWMVFLEAELVKVLGPFPVTTTEEVSA